MNSVLFLGDSITDCGHCFDPRGLGDGYVSMLAELPELSGFSIINRGQDGFTIRDVRRLLRSFPVPDGCSLISLLAGVNDAALYLSGNPHHLPEGFRREFSGVLEDIRNTYRGPLLVMEPFLFSSPAELLGWLPVIRQISALIRESCTAYGAHFLPLMDTFRHEEEERGTAALSPDGIHLSSEGNRHLASQWFTAAAPLLALPGVSGGS